MVFLNINGAYSPAKMKDFYEKFALLKALLLENSTQHLQS